MSESQTTFLSLPRSRKSIKRLIIVAAVAFVVFRFLFMPVYINGSSMEPTYMDGRVNFCWRLHYAFSKPQRGDIVCVRLAGSRYMYLKRIVGLAGETVEFRDGILYINRVPVDEPYVQHGGRWELPPRQVRVGNVYVVGDNRSMDQKLHSFGQTPIARIVGVPLW